MSRKKMIAIMTAIGITGAAAGGAAAYVFSNTLPDAEPAARAVTAQTQSGIIGEVKIGRAHV